MVLRNCSTQAVVGMASWTWRRPGHTCLVDLYCHPRYWDGADRLLSCLELPRAERYLAYLDSACQEKESLLRARGFRLTARWRKFPSDLCREPFRYLPRSRAGGALARIGWRVAAAVDRPIVRCWRTLSATTGSTTRIPVRWPGFPLTHALWVDLSLFRKKGAETR